MTERRRAAKLEPIIVELEDGNEYLAHPLPWMDRNDLGNEILKQYNELTNDAIKSFVGEDGTPQLDLMLNDKLKDPAAILKLAYPQVAEWPKLTWPEILELIYAACDVNGLENLRQLIDPNSRTPDKVGGTNSSGEDQIDTQKTPFTEDSDSSDLTEPESSNSPTLSSPISSPSTNEESGTTGTGE